MLKSGAALIEQFPLKKQRSSSFPSASLFRGIVSHNVKGFVTVVTARRYEVAYIVGRNAVKGSQMPCLQPLAEALPDALMPCLASSGLNQLLVPLVMPQSVWKTFLWGSLTGWTQTTREHWQSGFGIINQNHFNLNSFSSMVRPTRSLLFIIALCLVFSPVHPDLHGDPVQAHHLQRLRLPRLVPGHRLLHGYVLGGLHTHLRPVQDLPVPWSHLQRGEATTPSTGVGCMCCDISFLLVRSVDPSGV